MKNSLVTLILACTIMSVGCLPPRASDLNTESYDFYVANAIAVMKLKKTKGPRPVSPVDDDELKRRTARPVSECDECLDINGRPIGKVGDGTVMRDCPYCDSNGDGNNDDSFGEEGSVKPAYGEGTKQDKIKFIPDKLDLSIVPDLVWHTNTADATAKATEFNKRIVVLLSSNPPSSTWNSAIVKDYIRENFILLKVNLNEEDAKEAWTNSAIGSVQVKDRQLVDPTITVLSSDGKFIYSQEKGFKEVSDSSIELLNALKSLN